MRFLWFSFRVIELFLKFFTKLSIFNPFFTTLSSSLLIAFSETIYLSSYWILNPSYPCNFRNVTCCKLSVESLHCCIKIKLLNFAVSLTHTARHRSQFICKRNWTLFFYRHKSLQLVVIDLRYRVSRETLLYKLFQRSCLQNFIINGTSCILNKYFSKFEIIRYRLLKSWDWDITKVIA